MIPARLRLSVFLGVLCSFAPEASAETIEGKVRDSSGVAVVRAEVSLTTAELTVVAATRSDDQGSFSLTAPVAGRYLLIVRAPAFREARLAVHATPGTPAIVDSIRAGLVFQLKQAVGVEAIREREHDFIQRAIARWKTCDSLQILGNAASERLSIKRACPRSWFRDGRCATSSTTA